MIFLYIIFKLKTYLHNRIGRWWGVRIVCPGGTICLSAKYCFNHKLQNVSERVGIIQIWNRYHLIEL